MGKIQLSDHFTYKRLLKFVWPSIIMMIFTSIYGVVDGLFVSNFAGKTPFAALNFIWPFIMILSTPGFMLGTGGSALVAKTLGEGNRKKANGLFSMFCYIASIAGAVITVGSYILIPTVARIMGAEGDMLYYSVLYGRIMVLGCIPQMLHFVYESFIITAEKPSFGLKITIAAGVTNMVLDAVFICVFGWGIAGAAAATVLSQCVGGFVPFIYFARPNTSLLCITKPDFDFRALLKACTNGSSELMSNISMSFIGMLYNIQLMEYLGENGIAAYGVMMYLNFFFIASFIGYSIGTAPIIGFHYGAKNNTEISNVLSKSIKMLLIGGAAMFVAGEVAAVPVSSIYVNYDKELYDITVHGFRIYSISFLPCGFAIFASSFFTALNDGVTSAIISFLRTLVFQFAAVMLLPLIMGADGLWYSVVAAEFMAVAVSAVFMEIKRKKYGY